ncbi:AAA family ATPase [Pseudodesulfovibrio piezophilus]|uniref:ATPase associated with various cellular activities AAA_3 n=1 Tax=Pseudodesulfovibrio piezophilus (strain DSM 21447 / JCM 15486 / C1TLV30) TaxID=1322246 RepID=M1WU26_PSEP2|nr:MoxR family ATPase [Pseudodesulfovibrio piezophilus]CCH50162.1 ATPase associated with various cellular activities AAA_3 [Pseudodesulfovibrio piezophilus C1TLV30]
MIPNHIKQSLKTLIPLRQPAFLWGAPGVGKSQVVAQVADELGMALTDVRAVLLDPVDLRGLPSINSEGVAHWAPPAFLPTGGKGVLFLDELNAAPPLVQAACYQLVLDRKIGEYTLPDGWTVIAAGNRETDRAVTHRMPSALANRFVHLDFSVDVEAWLQWADQAGLCQEVSAFIRFRPNLLHNFDPKKNEKAFPSPRSWEFAARIVASVPDPDVELSLLKGTVGPGAAAEFAGFSKMFRQLPDPDGVINHPETADVPDEPAVLYALCEALAQKADEETTESIMAYASRLPSEFGVLLVRDAVKTHRGMVDSPAFSQWATANSDVLL